MAESVKLQFNPSTQKLHFNPVTKKLMVTKKEEEEDWGGCSIPEPMKCPLWDNSKTYYINDFVEHNGKNWRCILGYVPPPAYEPGNEISPPYHWEELTIGVPCTYGSDSVRCHKFPPGQTPKYIVITFWDVRKCSDQTLWTAINKSFCLIQTLKYWNGNPTADLWIGSAIIDGIAVKICYDATGGPADTFFLMFSGSYWNPDNYYFVGTPVDFCCPYADNDIVYSGYGGCDIQRIAYGGEAGVCNPCTGTWGPCEA